jgi:hypothetical protein
MDFSWVRCGLSMGPFFTGFRLPANAQDGVRQRLDSAFDYTIELTKTNAQHPKWKEFSKSVQELGIGVRIGYDWCPKEIVVEAVGVEE